MLIDFKVYVGYLASHLSTCRFLQRTAGIDLLKVILYDIKLINLSRQLLRISKMQLSTSTYDTYSHARKYVVVSI